MNKKIYIIFFILIWFILNIFFYLVSDSYRYFMQDLHSDNKKYIIDDRFKINISHNENIEKSTSRENSIFSWLNRNFWENKIQENKIQESEISEILENEDHNIVENKDFIENKKDIEPKVKFVSKREEIRLTNIERNILEALEKYNLKQVEIHPKLFDLTWEYPSKYFEFYSENLTLYFFWNKNYNNIKDIFEVLTYELPFSINEVNNFWEKSFFINLDPLFKDKNVRIVIKKSNRTFWIKIKRDLYEKIRNDLWNIFNN